MPAITPDACHLFPVIVRRLGVVEYQDSFDAMRKFTTHRHKSTPDEIWLLQHPPTFTQGRNGKPEHLLDPGDIPLIQVDRGGQVTYHGPGQIIVYLLFDLHRRKMGVRQLVTVMEDAVIELLAEDGITACTRADAPGVYVEGAKVAALGLRVKRGCSYHGLSLNIDMDLEPFSRINPCGYPDMAVTDLRHLGINDSLEQLADQLVGKLTHQLPL
ncbi:MAG: lipoyl(octanoyl) transferase LipB [Pseudomonadota bacterium]